MSDFSAATSRNDARLEALADLRRKLHRSAVAMSFLPAPELARHLGLPTSGIGERLLGDHRLVHRLYWHLVDADLVPDIGGVPDHGLLQVIDSSKAFETSCEAVDAVLTLKERGTMINKDEVKRLARRFGDKRLRWAWENRDIWAERAVGQAPKANPASSKPGARRDSRRLVLDHLAREMPEIRRWMSHEPHTGARSPQSIADGQVVARVIDRLIEQSELQHDAA